MCGIAGIAYTERSKELEDWSPQETAQLLFPALRHRGPHAFGWMAYDGDELTYDTFTGDVGKLSNLDKVHVPDDARWMVLHVRWATHGDVGNQHNNHPILHGNILGVHNGVLRNEDKILDVTGREYDDAEVDSEAIFAAVNKWGHREGLRKIEGDMATVYTRADHPDYLYFAKSHGRPLVFARTRAGSLVWASERKILHEVFGYDLTNIRELNERQLVRVADAKVRESCQYAPDPPVSTRRWSSSSGSITVPSHRPWSPGSGSHSGITDYMDRQRLSAVRAAAKAPAAKVQPPPPSQRLTKKQRQRARRADLARTEMQRIDDLTEEIRQRDLRAASPEGLHYYNGILVTADELELLLEFAEDQDGYVPDEDDFHDLELAFMEDGQ